MNCKHNKTHTNLYHIWSSMKQRCYNIRSREYKYYGARGVTICDEWLEDFMNFYNWAMDNGYREGLSIDRINNSNSYSPDNCRWTDKATQNRNRRSSITITIKGETHCLSEWCEILGLKYHTIKQRLYHNWPIEQALELEVRK